MLPILKRNFHASLCALLTLFAVAAMVAGCAGTKAAYSAATSISDTAFVVTEHYAAVVKEAAQLAQNPATPASAIDSMRTADQVAKPMVLALRSLAEAYDAAQSAENEVALQEALNRAVVALSDLIRAVKGART